ncbi:MAG: hypothetical protein J2O49_09520 [Sciscionella sp.]|nr:hypothetical protein [Sciscionella sp.]
MSGNNQPDGYGVTASQAQQAHTENAASVDQLKADQLQNEYRQEGQVERHIKPQAQPSPYDQGGQGASGGHFEIDINEAKSIVTDLDKLIDDFKSDEHKINTIRYVKQPGPDPVSIAHAKALSDWGGKQFKRHQQRIDYAQAWRDKLQSAIDSYSQQESATTDDMNRHARSIQA